MKLIVLKNNNPVSEVEVDVPDLGEKYEIFVGRADDCHVLIDDPLISRHHFVVKNDGPNWFVEKLSQLGVVLINGSTAGIVAVKNGDEVKCGPYSIFIAELPTQTIAQPHHLVPEQTPVYQAPVIPEPILLQEMPEDDLEPLDSDLSMDPTELLSPDSSEDVPLEETLEQPSDEYVNLEEEASEGFVPDEVSQDTFDPSEVTGALEGFADETDGGGSENESTRFFKAFVNYQLVLFGDHAPYDRFLFEADEIFIGRDTRKCQIVLDDPEVSSVHAVLRKSGNDVSLEDLNSSNGTILNGERINKAHVSTGDDFIIGSTTFTLEVKSDLLDAESDRLMPVEEGQVIETEEIIEEEIPLSDGDLDFSSEGPPEKSVIKRVWKDPKKRKFLIYGLVAVALGALFLPEDNVPKNDPDAAKTSEAQPGDKKVANKPKEKDPTEEEKQAYEHGVDYFESKEYANALLNFEKIEKSIPNYRQLPQYLAQTRAALAEIAEAEKRKREEEERLIKKKKVEELVEKARGAVKERQSQVAETYFNQIIELDPENVDVPLMRTELSEWQKEQEAKALEEARRVADRKKKVDELQPGKTAYLKKEWYRAILKLEEFTRIKGMDEDLLKEGSDMLADAKNQLISELGPLLGKARSLKEGQDFKNAYEAYLEVLKIEPTNAEALNEVDEIKNQIEGRSKRIYREAIIAESLSLFTDAKEKFQEVQQISPTDSEYYHKATQKLRNYLE